MRYLKALRVGEAMSIVVSLEYVDQLAKAGDLQAQEMLMPKRATEHAAGFDLVAANVEAITLLPGRRALVPTGIAIALPPGFEAQIRPRSGLAIKHGVTCLNSPGTIDADYRGEIGVILINHGTDSFRVERGMRVAQMVIAQVVAAQIGVALQLDSSVRGVKGFGSTGMVA